MKLFKSIQSHFAVVGISLHHANQKYLLNTKNMTVTVTFGLTFIAKGMYLVHVAEKFEEFTASVFVVLALVAITSSFEIFIWKMSNVFQLIDILEKMVNESKSM